MKRSYTAVFVGILLAGSAAPSYAQSLLGGLIGGSGDNAAVTIGSGEAGNSGLVNVGTGGSSGGGLDINIGGGEPAANVSIGTRSGSASGSVLDVDIGARNGLGGASDGLADVNVGGAGGGGGLVGINVLPRRGANPGTPSDPGQPGGPVVAGLPGPSGTSNTNDGGFLTGGSSKIAVLARLLEDREWLRFAAGNAVCLPPSGVASVTSLIRQRDADKANELLGSYADDISNLRRLLAQCGNRTISQADIERAIAVDLRRDGTVVLYVL